MLSAEKRLAEFISKNKLVLFVAIVSVLGLLARIRGIDFASPDYRNFLEDWFYEIRELGGLKALGTQVGDYNITYQFIICLMTYLPLSPLLLYKLLSFVFDYLMAWAAARFVGVIGGNKLSSAVIYGVVLLCPTVVYNSALWAQCDSIYTFFVLLSLISLYEKRDIRAFVYLGVAFAFKLQAVFVIPFFIYHYFTERRWSLCRFGITLGTFYALCLPGIIAGRSLLAPFTIYLGQTGNSHQVCANIPNIWSLVNGNAYTNSPLGMGIALVGLGLVLLLLIDKKGALADAEHFTLLATWTVWTAVMLLPEMHERYMYIGDILLMILAVRNRKWLVFAVGSVCVSLYTYSMFLYDNPPFGYGMSLFYILLWVMFSLMAFKAILPAKNEKELG